MILVTGATGFIGRHLVTRLLSEGRRVRCLLDERRSHHLPWAQDAMPEIRIGSLFDEQTVFQAVTGVDVIFHLESAQWWGHPRDLERIDLNGTRALVIAARAARVGRIITMSHLGASPSAAYPLLRVKGLVEEVIRTSGLAYTILRSAMVFGEDDTFVNYIAMQLRATPLIYLMPGQGEVSLQPLYIEDLVSALVAILSSLNSVDNMIEIGGPEYITLEDLIRTVMRVSGTPRTIVPIPPYALRWLTTVYSRVLPRSLVTGQWFDLLATNKTAHIGNLYRHFGIHPRRFEDTLLTYMHARRYGLEVLRTTLRRPVKI